ncbi:winged helix DNA-binding protein [Ruminococcaceae bacterium OttesenSCG-928-A11]|nr:winged helix DNA-binding protein [Ruminococcaceae bacterium OttesenSCG-928-A11]
MKTELLGTLAEFLEKQDLLSKLTEGEGLHGYGYSDTHTIAAVGQLEAPNVSAIARHLNMTKGAISKITKRLLAAGVLEAYSMPDNRQKIFFRLTPSGRALYQEHENRHALWAARDRQFLSRFTDAQLADFAAILRAFNGYLGEQIKELGGAQHAD